MNETLLLLCGTAASVGFLHTLLGPDHYLPFVAMSRVGNWSFRKTMFITVLCGIGHVLSSVVLGLAGIALGVAVFKLESIESWRGDLAGWLFIALGAVYTAWGIKRAFRLRRHAHLHVHEDGTVHAHEHHHSGSHLHVHESAQGAVGSEAAAEGRVGGSMTPWVLFTIFLFGPCEPLIPILMYPAAEGHVAGAVLVAVIFGVVTIATMTTAVALGVLGVGLFPFARLERYTHAMAGFVVLACGAAIKLGL